ncbi:hypothetical protein FDP41_007851 [Naegleria fowleri]|uniref:TATA box binding protein associated factor (TAF) histone-like fold domain-containing protein n=1 Tax=Naegleria fowleri TaxID=5763 RepID=A0A6A5C846_NAEFO|nr:uncharacterized protein FDP41_007851 [Naegleria fowleri]KAF0983936.1 hypothetical protein FDP41_007851 [Naegleria fowleri]
MSDGSTSFFQKETVQVIAQSLGINKLKDDIAQTLALDVEYRIREIIQDASKFMRHSKRKLLTTDDVNHALSMKNIEPLYGFRGQSSQPSRFRRVKQTKDLYFLEDVELDLKDCLEKPLPKVPIGPSIFTHWLAIQGIQPKIPQNPSIEDTESDRKKPKEKDQSKKVSTSQDPNVEFKPLVKHVLSEELQMYYEKVTDAIKDLSNQKRDLRKAAIESLANDPGINQLIPYFTQFIASEVTNNLRNLTLLYRLMEMTKALLVNPNIHIELYLHQLMPSILTCIVGKTLCENPNDNHWSLRDFSANIIAYICRKFGSSYHTLQPRITKTLLHAFLDPKRSRTTHYGAIVGITALGSHVTQLLFLEPPKNSNLKIFCNLLLPELVSPDMHTRHNAFMCFKALLTAAGTFFTQLSRFFKLEQQERAREYASSVTSFEEEEEENTNQTKKKEQRNIHKSEEALKIEKLTREMRERMNSSSIPEDVAERYSELYDLFGESVFSFIDYDIYKTSENVDSFSIRNLIM